MCARSGEKTAFAYSDEIAAPCRAAERRAPSRRRPKKNESRGAPHAGAAVPRRDPIESLPADAKVALLEKLERKCRALDPRITQVWRASAANTKWCSSRVPTAISADVRPLVAFRAGDRRSERPARKRQLGGGGRSDYSHFTDEALERYAVSRFAGAHQSRSSAGACRNDDGGARSRLAGRTAARSRGPRSRRRFQSQGTARRFPDGLASAWLRLA